MEQEGRDFKGGFGYGAAFGSIGLLIGLFIMLTNDQEGAREPYLWEVIVTASLALLMGVASYFMIKKGW